MMPSGTLRSAIAMIAAMFVYNANDALVKLASTELPVSQLVALRGAFAIVFIGGIVVAMGHLPRIAGAWSWPVLRRSGLEAIAAFLFITAIANMPLGAATTIFLASPLILTALAVPLLGEKVGWRRWTAVTVGFVGAIVVMRPGAADFNMFGLFALACAVVAALRDIYTRNLDPGIPTPVVALSTTVVVAMLGAAGAAVEPWVVPSTTMTAVLALAAALLATGNLLIVIAFRGAEVSLIGPLRYTLLVWAMLAGFVIFGEVPDGWGILGSLLIVGSGLYALHRERVRRREREAG